MTVVATDLLLEATAVAKTYGAVVALSRASLAVRPGEVHALMGANGAGKSTLVKILTGVIRPDGGTIDVGERTNVRVSSPAAAARIGLAHLHAAACPRRPHVLPAQAGAPGRAAAGQSGRRDEPDLAGRSPGEGVAGP